MNCVICRKKTGALSLSVKYSAEDDSVLFELACCDDDNCVHQFVIDYLMSIWPNEEK